MSFESCACGNNQPYEQCCQPYHLGKRFPENAEKLMRARYTAYALKLPDFLIATTHVSSPQFTDNKFLWKKRIIQFLSTTDFKKLEVFDFQEFGDVAVVTFTAHAVRNGTDLTFTEKSCFIKTKNKWSYRSGHTVAGRAPHIATKQGTKVLPVAYYGEPVLRKRAEPIAEITDEIRQLAKDMIETMYVNHGAGIAAPQVHHSLRMFIVMLPDDSKENEPIVVINPKFSSPSKNELTESEGCLSIPFLHEEVSRPDSIIIEYTTLEGQVITQKYTGYDARIFMHENDHINGVLYIDRISKKKRSAIEPTLKSIEKRLEENK